jgi:hypothetical protein
MRNDKALADAMKLFTQAAPYDLEDEREAVLANMRRLRMERRAGSRAEPAAKIQAH